MDKFITVILLLCYKGILSLDPCTSYKELNDETMRSDYNSTFSNGLLEPGWYRYMKTQIGTMISSCPNEHSTMCGTKRQIWINGTIPGRNCETEVKLCMKDGSSCCDEANRIRTKNCNDLFMIYNLFRHPVGSRFCFGKKVDFSDQPVFVPSIVPRNKKTHSVRKADANAGNFNTSGTKDCAGSSTISTTQSTSTQTTKTIPSSSTAASSSSSSISATRTTRTSTKTISSTHRSSSPTKITLNTPKTRIPTYTQTTTFISTITHKVTRSPTTDFHTFNYSTNPQRTQIFTLTSTASVGTGPAAVNSTNSFTTPLPTSITQILTTTNQTPSSKTSTAASTEANPSTKDKPTNVGLIVGACIGSLLILTLIAACSWKLCFRRNRVSHRLPRPPNIDEDIALKIRPT